LRSLSFHSRLRQSLVRGFVSELVKSLRGPPPTLSPPSKPPKSLVEDEVSVEEKSSVEEEKSRAVKEVASGMMS
jgi:hypothetical protein